MKTIRFTLTMLFLIAISSNALARKKAKHHKIENTKAIYEMVIAVDSYLERNVSDEDYKQTGINTWAGGDCVAIMCGSYNKKKYNLDNIFHDLVDATKNKNIDFRNIRYFIIGNWSGDLFGKHGETIAITGYDLASNINNFDALFQKLIRLKDGEEYPADPNLSKIIRAFRMDLSFSKAYDQSLLATVYHPTDSPYWRNNRLKLYLHEIKGCRKSLSKLN